MELDGLEEAVNEVSDRDGSWWPFLWLRPHKTERFSLRRVTLLAVLWGLPCSLFLGLIGATLIEMSLADRVLTTSAFPLLFLFAGSVVVAPMWNRRAARLRRRAD
jgi:hypothetical protein